LLGGSFLSTPCYADEEWAFSDVAKIKIRGVSGDVTVLPAKGKDGLVKLHADVSPRESFHPEVEQKGSTLYIEEKWRGDNTRGTVEWTIYLPQQKKAPRIQVSNASGDLGCDGISARIRYDTASGDCELTSVELLEGSRFSTASGDGTFEDMTISESTEFSTASGDLEFNNTTIEESCQFSTASGDIRCIDCKFMDDAAFSTASGDVTVRDSRFLGRSEFSSASGDVSISLSDLPGEAFAASTASGNIMLDVEDFGENFTLVLIKRKNKGRISCPFKFTDEETFEDYHVYEKKIVTRGSGYPEIELRTASGKVTVRD
jgi:DUF4097 and DUF4098 domain-containing protein YvlB